MDILDPQKWMPLIQASVENLLTPFEAMAQRLIATAVTLLEAALSRIVAGAIDQLNSKTIPLITNEVVANIMPSLNQIATDRETQLLDKVEAMVQGYQIGLIKKP